MDKTLFQKAIENVNAGIIPKNGIGTLSEKTLHAVLKNYFEPYSGSQEIKIGGFIADIVGENGIIEIQTRAFDKLRKKLECFLEAAPVTVVYPVAFNKWLVWINNETGEMSERRRSPKKGSPYEIFSELYKIKHLLLNGNLRFCIVMLDIVEYRNLDGYSKNKKKGSSRSERIPTDIIDEIYIDSVYNYNKLIPEQLPVEFTASDFKKAAKISLSTAQTALNVLKHVGAVEHIGKSGRAFLYKKSAH